MTKRSNEDEDEDKEDASNCAKNRPRTEMGLVVAQKPPDGVGLFVSFEETGGNLKEIDGQS